MTKKNIYTNAFECEAKADCYDEIANDLMVQYYEFEDETILVAAIEAKRKARKWHKRAIETERELFK